MARQTSYRPGASPYATPRDREAVAQVRANAVKSHTRKQSGDDIELLFARTHHVYQERGSAIVVKLHAPTAGVPTALRRTGSALVDYLGYCADGSGVAFDVKGITGHPTLAIPKIPASGHKHYTQAVRDHDRLINQAKFLRSLRSMRVRVAFLCVDKARERAWIMSDVDRIAAGHDVPIRHRDADLWPAVAFADAQALSAGAPVIDYLGVWPAR